MPEGLSATEVGKEIAEHAKHSAHSGEQGEGGGGGRLIPIAEAVLLSIVTITAAWSGFSAAKWGTESSLEARQGLDNPNEGEPVLRGGAHLQRRGRDDVQRLVHRQGCR